MYDVIWLDGGGGHSEELRSITPVILKGLDVGKLIYISGENSDYFHVEKLINTCNPDQLELIKVDKPRYTNDSSLVIVFFTVLKSIYSALWSLSWILKDTEQVPLIVLSSGPGIALVCIWVFKFLCLIRLILMRQAIRVKIVHLETLCRGFDGSISLSGTLIRPACDLAIVQWGILDEKQKRKDLDYVIGLISKTKWSHHTGLVCDSVLMENSL